MAAAAYDVNLTAFLSGFINLNSSTEAWYETLQNSTYEGENSTMANNITYKTEYEIYMQHIPIKITLEKWVPIVYYIFGLSGNFLAFLVWIQRRMQHSSGCYLAALALSDLLFLLLHLLYEIHYMWQHKILNYVAACQIFTIFFMCLQYTSPLLVLAFTVERYLAVCHPFKRDKICTTSLAIKVIAGITMGCLVINGIQGYFWIYNQDIDDCDPRPAAMAGGVSSLWSIWSWITELLFFGLVPIAVLFLNILVIREARKLAEHEKRELKTRHGRRTSTTTIMLLAVSFFLIFTTLPVTICYVLHPVFPGGDNTMTDEQMDNDQTWQEHFYYMVVKTVVQNIGMAHYACNFYIYCITGKMFRKELALIFKRIFRQQIPVSRFNSTQNTNLRTSFTLRSTLRSSDRSTGLGSFRSDWGSEKESNNTQSNGHCVTPNGTSGENVSFHDNASASLL